MTRTRLVALLMALALAFATASAVVAQDESPAPEGASEGEEMSTEFDPSSIEEWNEEEALVLYAALEEELLAMGVAEEDIPAAVDHVEETYGNLNPQEVEELLAARMLSDRDGGDDEFGQSEEDEPELGDDEEEEDSE